MLASGTDIGPALFRAGDIGVSSEWRDLTYDWWPLLTADGVFTYSYLRDLFDKQRTLRPFILNPEGPPKQRLQRVLQRKTEYGVQGPEYLLETVGLLYVEVQRGPSPDPSRPKHTAITNYVVGYLERANLDWTMVERVLNALMIGLDPTSAQQDTARAQKRAQAAIRSLGLAGMLQNEDPEYLFEPDGAWVTLLPKLIYDERWIRLFTHLHGTEALTPYRQQARAWVDLARRRIERLMQENNTIRDQLLAAQRRPVRSTNSVSAAINAAPIGTMAQQYVPGGTPVTKESPVDQNVPGEAGTSPRGNRAIQGPTGTGGLQPQLRAVKARTSPVTRESQASDQINDQWSHEKERDLHVGTSGTRSLAGTAVSYPPVAVFEQTGLLPALAEHVRDSEMATTRLDAYFWSVVRQILQDESGERYAYTASERKAIQRLFGKLNIPIGALLAALRAVMTLPSLQRPQTLAHILKLDVFHACLEQATALARSSPAPSATGESWSQFVDAYRTVGLSNTIRNISPIEWPLIADLFERQPVACWEVLRRVQRMAEPPQLSFEYLKRAVINNQRATTMQAMQAMPQQVPCDNNRERKSARLHSLEPRASESPSDPRRELLEREGINPNILTSAITLELIEAWINEADARVDTIEKRAGWLAWGIRKERFPRDVVELAPRREDYSHQPSAAHVQRADSPAYRIASHDEVDQNEQGMWKAVLENLQMLLPADEFETWLTDSTLIQIDNGCAVIGTSNIFTREKLESCYLELLIKSLRAVVGHPVRVQVVIGRE